MQTEDFQKLIIDWKVASYFKNATVNEFNQVCQKEAENLVKFIILSNLTCCID